MATCALSVHVCVSPVGCYLNQGGASFPCWVQHWNNAHQEQLPEGLNVFCGKMCSKFPEPALNKLVEHVSLEIRSTVNIFLKFNKTLQIQK